MLRAHTPIVIQKAKLATIRHRCILGQGSPPLDFGGNPDSIRTPDPGQILLGRCGLCSSWRYDQILLRYEPNCWKMSHLTMLKNFFLNSWIRCRDLNQNLYNYSYCSAMKWFRFECNGFKGQSRRNGGSIPVDGLPSTASKFCLQLFNFIYGILKRSAYEHNSTRVIVFRAYVIRLSQPRRYQLVCEYWKCKRTTSSLRKLLDWRSTLCLSIQLWVVYALRCSLGLFSNCVTLLVYYYEVYSPHIQRNAADKTKIIK